MTSGLGMGLYISTEIINTHHGKIGVSSEPGKGSNFYFDLPLVNA
jgi:two-component system phosphate regulon sensor histidine kinase PhoR